MRDRIEELIGQLASEDVRLQAEAAGRLIEAGGAAAVTLSRVCDTPSDFSHRAADALRKIGRDAVLPLVQVVKTGDRDAQVHAIVALHLLGEPSSLQPLIGALETPFAEVRKAAISALWSLRDPKAVEPLLRRLQDDDIEVAASAVCTLGWIGDRRAVGPLLLALENRNWRLRSAAAHGLGDLLALENPNRPLQSAAARDLGDMGDEHILGAIRRHLLDRKPRVRKSVKYALSLCHARKLDQHG